MGLKEFIRQNSASTGNFPKFFEKHRIFSYNATFAAEIQNSKIKNQKFRSSANS
jgi:hypothetical protein